MTLSEILLVNLRQRYREWQGRDNEGDFTEQLRAVWQSEVIKHPAKENTSTDERLVSGEAIFEPNGY